MRMRAATAAAALALLPACLAAQAGPRIGGQASFAQDVNAGLGVRLEQPLTPPRVHDLRLQVAFDYFFPSSPVNYWELNADLAWGIGLAGTRLRFYAGGGLNMARTSVSGVPRSAVSDVGVNLLFGLRIPTSTRFDPFVELRPELGGGDHLVLSVGLMF
jgi:hypothetical protein